MLKIQLLGPPIVTWDDERINIPRRTVRALLFYMAACGKPIGRAQLAELIWPDEEDAKQRSQLRSLLNKLRGALPDGDYVQTYHDTLSLDFEQVSVDLLHFRQLVSETGALTSIWPANEPLPAHVYNQLVNAAQLWYGSVFIHSADMSISRTLENWWTITAQNLEHEYIAALKTLIRHENLIGASMKALQWLQDAFAINDLDEEIHYEWLVCLLRVNEPQKVRQHYTGVQALFQERLGIPVPENIRALEPMIFCETEADPSHGCSDWPVRPSINLPFVGQRSSLNTLRQVCQNGGSALVVGEAGSGKTQLVQEVYQRLASPPRLLLLPCYLVEEYLPYQPWIDMLRSTVTRNEWQKLSSVWAEPLTMLIPEIKEWRNDLNVSDSQRYASAIVFEAVRNLLLMITESRPLLVFMDDAHWADESSLALLAYLIRHSFFSVEHGGLVITSRVEEENETLSRLVLNLLKQELKRIEISRLDAADVSELAFYALHQNLPEILIECLGKETGGNTFFLLEMLRAMMALPDKENIVTCDELPVSASMEKLILGRMQNLSEQAGDVLLTAAVQGRRFDLQILEKAISLSADGLVTAVEALEQAQLIRKAPQTDDTSYIFVHELLRDALIANMSDVRKRALHKKIAQALEEILGQQTGAKAALLAHHYAEANEYARAFDYWVKAGLHAYYLFSVEGATLAFQHAEALIEKTVLQDEQIYTLYACWGDMAFENDNAGLVDILNQRLLKLGKEQGSDLLIGTALDGLSDACMARNQFEQGLKYVREAIPYLEASNNITELMDAYCHCGVFLYMLNHFVASQEYFLKALNITPDSRDNRKLRSSGHANYQMAVTFVGMGWPTKAIVYAEKSLWELTLSKWPYGPVIAHSAIGLTNYYLADYATGRDHSLQSIVLAERIDGWRMLGYAHVYAGMNETELALLDSAWIHAQKAIEIGEKHNHSEITSMGHKIVGDIYAHLSALPQAAAAYQRGVDVAGKSFMALENLHRLGATLALMGDPYGEAMLEKALNEALVADLGIVSTYAQVLHLNLFLARGEYEVFYREVDMVAEEFKKRSNPDTLAWTEYLKAAAAFQQGNTEQALSLLEALAPVFKRTPLFWIELRALGIQVQVLRALHRDVTETIMRITEMLTIIEDSLGNAPLTTEWQAFLHQTQQLLVEKS